MFTRTSRPFMIYQAAQIVNGRDAPTSRHSRKNVTDAANGSNCLTHACDQPVCRFRTRPFRCRRAAPQIHREHGRQERLHSATHCTIPALILAVTPAYSGMCPETGRSATRPGRKPPHMRLIHIFMRTFPHSRYIFRRTYFWGSLSHTIPKVSRAEHSLEEMRWQRNSCENGGNIITATATRPGSLHNRTIGFPTSAEHGRFAKPYRSTVQRLRACRDRSGLVPSSAASLCHVFIPVTR
ncbi:hypothetical protein F7D09_1062 [Bifidobacterium leontopitheci]|uniref:Uncharacterized protein n=1 Tax=Bifidobacterium leontopitheci TaxID=2650774 RepID=A0A6I1GLI3_9BIFI|nr:hypothetical protein F7D09_1062 [Bifidobacterium leontopitheci]